MGSAIGTRVLNGVVSSAPQAVKADPAPAADDKKKGKKKSKKKGKKAKMEPGKR